MDPVQSGGPWTPGPCFVLTHNKGPTVAVVNSDGNIFGGFTESAWEGKTGNTAFDRIFSILERICSIQIYTF